jgi:prevent-host-death family protein
MAETRIGTRELKNKLSEYLRRVKAGQTITVTERGKPIGQIVPIRASVEDRLSTMVASGVSEWNGKKIKPYRPVAVNRSRHKVSDLVSQDRE